MLKWVASIVLVLLLANCANSNRLSAVPQPVVAPTPVEEPVVTPQRPMYKTWVTPDNDSVLKDWRKNNFIR